MKNTIAPVDAQDAIHTIASTICNHALVTRAFEIKLAKINNEIISSTEKVEDGFIYNGRGYNSLAEVLAKEYFHRTAEKYDEMDSIPSTLRDAAREIVHNAYNNIMDKYMVNFGIDCNTLTTILAGIVMWRGLINSYDMENELIDAIVNTLGY